MKKLILLGLIAVASVPFAKGEDKKKIKEVFQKVNETAKKPHSFRATIINKNTPVYEMLFKKNEDGTNHSKVQLKNKAGNRNSSIMLKNDAGSWILKRNKAILLKYQDKILSSVISSSSYGQLGELSDDGSKFKINSVTL